MNEEDFQSIFWRIVKWTAGIVTTLSVFSGIFWILFYSVNLANLSLIIPLRNWYQNTYWKTEGLVSPKERFFPPFDPIYTFQVEGTSKGEYSYIFWGKFSGIDIQREIIFLKGSDGQVYSFIIGSKASALNPDTVGDISMPIIIINNSSDIRSSTVGSLVDAKNTEFPVGKLFQVRWGDVRSLLKIQDDIKKNNTLPLNEKLSDGIMIMTFN